jgi:glucose/arabinose dehydrogenase
MRPLRIVASVLALALSSLIASGTGGADTTTGATGRPSVRLEPIAQVEEPTALAARRGDPTLYVAEQAGRVVAVRDGEIAGAVLDLRSRVTAGGEQGLLGIVFSPDGSKLYTNSTDRSGNTRIDEFDFVSMVDGGRAEPTSRRLLLKVRQPESNHNGGQLAFGPDGYLYIGLGDGGGADDEGDGHADEGNGQSLDTLLGKILRIDPTPSGTRPYTIPADNPFADGGGRPEIWSIGLRNPWRFSFDRETDDLWIADVGQNEWEEIDLAPAADGGGRGTNFGWPVFEASTRFRDEEPASDTVDPVLDLSHDDGFCAVTGGYVYRGTDIPALVGAYVYTDYCDGTLRWVRVADGKVTAKGTLGTSSDSVASLGEDSLGELYVLSQSDGLYRLDRR